MLVADPDEVMAWLNEISLRPCDFVREEDYDAYETERLVDTVLDIVKRYEEPTPVTIRNKYWAKCTECGSIFRAFAMAGAKARYCPMCGKWLKWE